MRQAQVAEPVGFLGHEVAEADLALGGDLLHVLTAVLEATVLKALHELLLGDTGEAPVLGDDDDLTAGELHAGTAESLLGGLGLVLGGAEGQQDLVDADASSGHVGLTPGLAHTSLQTIGTGAGKHLVDADDVERVGTDAHVEAELATVLGHVLVGLDTGSLKSLGGDLLDFLGDAVDAGGELLDGGLTGTNVVVADTGIRNTTAEAALGVGLVLAVAVAASGTATHDTNSSETRKQNSSQPKVEAIRE